MGAEQLDIQEEAEQADDMEDSLHHKIGRMNYIALCMCDKANEHADELEQVIGNEGMDRYWSIADGLEEEWIMNRIDGRCSLKAMMETSIEDIEVRVDGNIGLLCNIRDIIEKHGVEV